MMKKTTCFVLLWALSGACLARAQDTDASPSGGSSTAEQVESSPEVAAIQAQSAAFLTAFKNADAKAIAALWTEDGEYLDDTGRRFAGREAIEKEYAEFFAENPGATMQVAIDSLRLVSPNAAIEEGRAIMEPAPAGAAGVSKYTAFHSKVDGKWLMAVVRDTWIEAPAAARSAADLAWLIGTWAAEEHGLRTEFVCRWVADGRFIERRHTTRLLDGTTTSGVQLIGWNPQGGHVQSWDFSPDGGHAVGIWSPVDGGWQAKVVGTTGDGISTAAVNRLRRLDDNAHVWQSVQRSVGDTMLPDTNEVVIKRQPAP
jgi:uncharacterized protein (TIGR02246 family)